MQFYLTAVMNGITKEEKYSMFSFINRKKGREISNELTWKKNRNAAGKAANKDDMTVTLLMERFEEYCLPKQNSVIWRTKFFTRNQLPSKPIYILCVSKHQMWAGAIQKG